MAYNSNQTDTRIQLSKETPYHMEYRLVDGTEESFKPHVEEPEETKKPTKSPSVKKHVERLVVVPSAKPVEKVKREKVYEKVVVPAQNSNGIGDVLERLNKAVNENTKVMKAIKKQFCKDEEGNHSREDKVYVEVRASFIRIVDVDTVNQRFYAEVFIQGKWSEPRLHGKLQPELDMTDFKKYWSPKLSVVNIEGDPDEDLTWFHAKTYEAGYRYPVVFFRRRMRAMFKEVLELKHFPIDIQEITLQVTTERTSDEIELLEDPKELSQVFVDNFDDAAEWKLYQHVDVMKKAINSKSIAAKYRKPRIDIVCHVARKPGFYFWNTVLIMFLIQGLSFCCFSITPDQPHYRLMITFLLLLSAISFKVNLSKNLPTVSYLTYLDIYVYATLVFLCLQAIENAVVSAFVTLDGLDTAKEGDKYYMIGMGIFIFLFNIIFLIYVVYVYRKGHGWMKEKENKYRQKRERAHLLAPIETGRVKMEPPSRMDDREIILKPQETVYVVRNEPSPRQKKKKDKKYTAHLSYSEPAYRGNHVYSNMRDPESTATSNIYELPSN